MTPREHRLRAYSVLAAALRAGRIEHWRGKRCADCGEPAAMYDHRDYREPLVVAPVCRACNTRRGPGLPLPEPRDKKPPDGTPVMIRVKAVQRAAYERAAQRANYRQLAPWIRSILDVAAGVAH